MSITCWGILALLMLPQHCPYNTQPKKHFIPMAAAGAGVCPPPIRDRTPRHNKTGTYSSHAVQVDFDISLAMEALLVGCVHTEGKLSKSPKWSITCNRHMGSQLANGRVSGIDTSSLIALPSSVRCQQSQCWPVSMLPAECLMPSLH
jgi:hypothetical protein